MKRFIVILSCIAVVLLATGCSDIKTNSRQIVVATSDELNDALKNAEPADSILLKEGVYCGDFKCEVSGQEDKQIQIASYLGERATVTLSPDKSGAAIHMNGCENIVISDITFADMRGENVYGISMTGGESNITIRNCEFKDIETTDPGTENKAGGEANAILLLGETQTPISNISIENNKIHNIVNGWSENISVAGNCENIYVKENVVYDCTNIGIDFYGNAEYCENPGLDQPRNCECTGNRIYNCNSFYAANAGIYVDGAYDILIENNEVYGNDYGIEIGSEEWRDYYGKDNLVRGITVNNNDIHDNTECGLRIGGWTDDDTTGTVTDCVISENRFENNETEILLAKCSNIRFKGNKFDKGVSCKEAVEYDDAISKDKITKIIF